MRSEANTSHDVPAAGDPVYWDRRSELDPLAAVIDPADRDGRKNQHIHRIHARALERSGVLRPGQQILDFGCGTGRLSEHIHSVTGRVTGVDISPRMVDRARAGHGEPGCEFVAFDGERLPFDDASFDGAVSALVLQMYSAEPERFRAIAGDLARVLRPGAPLVLIERTAPSDGPAWSPGTWARELAPCGLRLETVQPARAARATPVSTAVQKGLVPKRLLGAAAGMDLAIARRRGIRAPYTEALMVARRE